MDPDFSFSFRRSVTEAGTAPYLDFSVNTNPIGLPDLVKQQLPFLSEIAGEYPDPDCLELRTRLARKYKIRPEQILCGSGADDLLYRLVFALNPRHALVVTPTFEEYDRALGVIGCEIRHYRLRPENQFTLESDIFSSLSPDCDLMILCNPNNPTGRLIEPALLRDLIDYCEAHKILLMVDECFMEFLPDWKSHTVKQLAAEKKHLLVIDAFTKTYSLAGFRLGFCISGNQELLSRMHACGQEFSVSAPAQLAGLCALMDHDYMKHTYELLSMEREWLISQLKALSLEVYPSSGNFLLFRTEDPAIRRKLLVHQIKVRDCSRFYGLGPEYCRIAVRRHEENKKLIQALMSTL